VTWDLQQAAKDKSKRGLEILEQCMEDTTCDWNTRLKAIEMLWERGYGRPQIQAVIETNHNFCIAPEVMELGQWLERKGQPLGDDAWLLEHQKAKAATQPAAPTEKRASGPPTIDLNAEEALLMDADPTCPPPVGVKLN
jgi:hypothetical protein